ncbi:hypothetical protein NC651_008750 [Populus alba x Populus x berolinensis]|nr:hypothetical protein NC651_008750 [Populus alba x Populus x berolinensis]
MSNTDNTIIQDFVVPRLTPLTLISFSKTLSLITQL